MTDTDLAFELRSLRAEISELRAAIASPPVRYLSIAQAATYAGVSERSIERLIASGKLSRHRLVPGRVSIDRVQLDSLAQGSTREPRTGRGKWDRGAGA